MLPTNSVTHFPRSTRFERLRTTKFLQHYLSPDSSKVASSRFSEAWDLAIQTSGTQVSITSLSSTSFSESTTSIMAHRQRAETYAKQLQAANGRILELEGEVADRDDKLAKLNETKVKHETALREHLAKAVRDQETAKTTLGKKIEEMKETETMLRTQLATRAITEATTNTMTRAISTDKLKNAANAEQTLRKQNSHLSDQNQKLQTELASKNGEIATLEKRVNDLIDAEKVEKESKKRKYVRFNAARFIWTQTDTTQSFR